MKVIWKTIWTTNITLKIDWNYWQYSENRIKLMTVFWKQIWTDASDLKSIWTNDSDLKIDLN